MTCRTLPFLILAIACATPTTDSAPAPAIGKADSTDRADSRCRVALRDLRRLTDAGPSGVREDCSSGRCFWVFHGTLDVASSALEDGDSPAVMFRSPADQLWREQSELTEVGGAPSGFRRFEFDLREHTISLSQQSVSSLERAELEVIALLHDDEGRLFDHNRSADPLSNLKASRASGWSVLDDARTCSGDSEVSATIQFNANYEQTVLGEIRAGQTVALSYDPARARACRGTHNGNPAWQIEAHLRAAGQHQRAHVVRFDSAFGTDENLQLAKFRVPPAATSVELWFRNTATGTCEAWDSNFGANYRFDVR